jgi:hypothetical protein
MPYRHLFKRAPVEDLNTSSISVGCSRGITSDDVPSPISIRRWPCVDGEGSSRIRSELDGSVVVVEESGDAGFGLVALFESGEREDVVSRREERFFWRAGIFLVELVFVPSAEVLDGMSPPGKLS